MLVRFQNRIRDSDCDWTSPATPRYNCFAWAVGDESRWWQPSGLDDHYWPPQYPVDDYSVATAVRVLGDFSFQPCPTADYEDGFDKIALFEKDGEWCHVAIQVSDSKWKSKLGGLEDVHHPLAPMDGGFYGKVVRYLKRPTKS